MKSLLLALVLVGANAFAAETYTFTGSTTMSKLISDAIDASGYSNNGDASHDVMIYNAISSGEGEKQLLKGGQGIAPMSREFNPKLVAAIKANQGADIVGHKIALDGIAVLVKAENSVKSLDKQTILDIYTCVVTDWSKIKGSGKSGPIVAWEAEKGSGTTDTFKEFIGYDKKKDFGTCVQRANSANEMGAKVAADPAAIGFAGVNEISAGHNRAVEVATVSGENGVLPTPTSIKSFPNAGSYPFTRYLWVYEVVGKVNPPADAAVSNVRMPTALESAFLKNVTHRPFMDKIVRANHFTTLP